MQNNNKNIVEKIVESWLEDVCVLRKLTSFFKSVNGAFIEGLGSKVKKVDAN